MSEQELRELEAAVGAYVALFRGQATLGGVLWVLWAMGYRLTAEPLPLPPVPAAAPRPDGLPPPTPPVDEIFNRLGR